MHKLTAPSDQNGPSRSREAIERKGVIEQRGRPFGPRSAWRVIPSPVWLAPTSKPPKRSERTIRALSRRGGASESKVALGRRA